MIICTVYLYIAIFGANVRFCRRQGRRRRGGTWAAVEVAGKQCGTASVGINGRLGSVMSASIQPRRERSPVVITSRSSGSSRKGGRARAARWRRLAAWRSRCAPSGWYQVRRSRRRVDRGAGSLVAHGKKFAAVSLLSAEINPEPRVDVALRRGSPAGTARGAGATPRLGRIRAQGARRARRLAQGEVGVTPI
jgi:hypothetical protein